MLKFPKMSLRILMLSVIILAAGKGTHMRSSLPKTLHTICGGAYVVLHFRNGFFNQR